MHVLGSFRSPNQMNAAGALVLQLEELFRKSSDLFSPEILRLRQKLKDYCERVLFNDPLEYGLRAEELMWRKVFYEYIQFVKSRHKTTGSPNVNLALEQQILAGIGYYYHLLHRLQSEFQYTPMLANFVLKDRGLRKNHYKKFQRHHEPDAKLHSFIRQACHRCLVYLGDLSRYLVDLGCTHHRPVAQKYYLDAIRLDPSVGMPYNQLGTLLGQVNYGCSAVYNYIKCLLCSHTFEGAENNLLRFLEANLSQESSPPKEAESNAAKVKHFISLFLKLCYNFQKGKVDDAQQYCLQVIQNLDPCLMLPQPGEEPNPDAPSFLTEEILFQVCVISMMCISRLADKHVALAPMATGLTLSLLSHLIYQCSQSFQASLNQLSESEKSEEANKKPLKNPILRLRELRRRRKVSTCSQDDSELSENEEDSDSDADDKAECLSNINSDSDSESLSSESLGEEQSFKEEEEEGKTKAEEASSSLNETPPTPEHPANLVPLTPKEFVDIIADNKFLSSLKILCDWMRLSTDVYCSSSDMNLLWAYLVNFFNTLLKIEGLILKEEEAACLSQTFRRYVEETPSNNNTWKQELPLPEDYEVSCLSFFSELHAGIKFDSMQVLTSVEKTFLRLHSILNFGRFLSQSSKTLVNYDAQKNIFYVSEESEETPAVNSGSQLKTVMRNMAHLWLKSEVSDLELQVKFGNQQHAFSPFLVPDTAAFTQSLPAMKKLLTFRKFVFIIPSTVIHNLDLLKRSSLEAREALRWLEGEMSRGHRFIRAQRNHEKLSLAPVKYPHKKDKETWEYFKALECCHYLTQRGNDLVSLVTSDTKAIKTLVFTLASSIGVSIKDLNDILNKINELVAKSKPRRRYCPVRWGPFRHNRYHAAARFNSSFVPNFHRER